MHQSVPEALVDVLACPRCFAGLRAEAAAVTCRGCGATYPVDDGIPIFVDARATEHDELDHLAEEHGHGHPATGADRDAHKEAQAAWFDRAERAEFEVERPEGAAPLYRFLLSEKFRRAVQPLGGRLTGRTALVVCGGSGMDAEFLARAGASVISSDISLGAAKRTRERSRRHGIPIASIVADVEHLPFRERAVDVVYVHDGLHHLAHPELGIREMSRVAARWVSITEPAQAALTSLAVRLGWAVSREESGNLVARLEPGEVARCLDEAGFSIVRSERYAMYYRHYPGRVSAFLSRPGLLRIATTGWRAANLMIGSVGNKLAVVAERREG